MGLMAEVEIVGIKGQTSSITDDTPIKLHVHNQYKFHATLSSGYRVMAEDEIGNQRAMPPL